RPQFNSGMKEKRSNYGSGFAIFQSHQCPYTYGMVQAIYKYATQVNIPVQNILIENCQDAQTGVHPYGTSCYLLDGEVLTYHPENVTKLIQKKKITHF
ncbi:MAG: hypothetical protein ACFFBD_17595, partial [Candidatus Hodarchaeota archaeon]